MGKTILMIEDDRDIMKINRLTLARLGYTILEASTLAEGHTLLQSAYPDLIILDIMLPDGSGLQFCKEVREVHHIPLLFLTARGENADIVTGLRLGGDDYLRKPYDLDVLCARVEALLRRTAADNPPLRVGALELNATAGRAYLNGRDLLLTPREFSLLHILLHSHGRYLTAKELYRRVWDLPAVDAAPVRQHIRNLRRKLGGEAPVSIEAEQGKGYRLIIRERD